MVLKILVGYISVVQIILLNFYNWTCILIDIPNTWDSFEVIMGMYTLVTDGPELSLAMQKLELHTPVSGGVNKNEEQVSSLEKPLEAVKKRAPSLIDKKLNPEFFQKLATEIEVAVPHNSPPSISQESENNLFEQGKEIKSGGQNGEELNNDSCSILCMSEKANEESNWQFIHNRLVQIEQQQSTLMQMIQVFEQ